VHKVKNVYQEQVCSNGVESENAKVACESNVGCIFYAEIIFHREFLPQIVTVSCKFYKQPIKRVITEFQESGSWYLLQDNAPAHSSGVVSEFLAKRGIPVLTHPTQSHALATADFFSP
jgi:hypothetical protein